MTPALTLEQLQERLATLHRASLELVRDTDLPSLLERIARLAMEQAGAQYAALGVLDEFGALERFIPVGITPEVVARMEHPPVGLGLIGALMRSHETIRIPDIAKDPRSVGFPPNHPSMIPFLGVPIYQGEAQLGQIYLTNKIGEPEFSLEDQEVIEMLASYASTAIYNARLYRKLKERDTVLTRRNETLGLLNDLASTLATSSDIDEILDNAVTQVM